MESQHRPALIEALARIAQEHPYDRKLLVARSAGEGREVLRALTAYGVSWIGFEVATPWQLAQKLVGARLAAEGLRVIDEFDHTALLDEAIDSVLPDAGGRLASLAEGAGLRRSIAEAVHALRLAGIDGAALARTRFRDEDKRAQLSRILTAFERALDRRSSTDVAGVFRLAVASLAVREVEVTGARVYLLPGQSARGLSGQLLSVLAEQGATVLPSDPVHGLAKPASLLLPREDVAPSSQLAWLHDVGGMPAGLSTSEPPALFAATSVLSELREVLRRAAAAGLQWDQVEIIATDPVAYGVALDGIAQRHGIPVTYAAGLPVARTRPGRAVAKYLEWIRNDFPADILREMLERGDIAPPRAEESVSGTALARRLRRLRIGRGRDRYLPVIERAAQTESMLSRPYGDDRTPAEQAADRLRDEAVSAGLKAILETLLAATPSLNARAGGKVDTASVARGVLALLSLVPCTTSVDFTAHARLSARLQRLSATATRSTTLDASLAVVESHLDTRVPAPDTTGGAPWGSAGGHLYLSDLEHGGYTGRAATFVVGLDAVRFPGSGFRDALLVDDDRRRLAEDTAGSALPTAAERVDERRYRLALLLARLRGRVCMSYSTWDALEGRAVPPSAEMLQAHRLRSGDPGADYDAMHRALAPAASPVARGDVALDSDDVWLRALTAGAVLPDGRAVVMAAFPGIAAGYAAGRSFNGRSLTAFHGAIAPRAAHDPRRNPDAVVSATQLQTLGICPHRYLLRYILRAKKPDDPETAGDRWLTPAERGTILHQVFERTIAQITDASMLEGLEDRAFAALADAVEAARATAPPPGEAVFAAELQSMSDDIRAFAAMAREDGVRWIDREVEFGRNGAAPVELDLDGEVIRVSGAIDRVDRLPDGSLAIIDYKTGSHLRYTPRERDYDGGRRLQHVLYAAAAERLYGDDVAYAEFQFPSRRSENHRAVYRGAALKSGLRVVSNLLDIAANGLFHPTNDREDCRFCDYASVCRATVNVYGDVASRRAEWSKASADPSLKLLRDVRGS